MKDREDILIEIVEQYEASQESSCSCHMNPPCSKCVECPPDNVYKEAKLLLDKPYVVWHYFDTYFQDRKLFETEEEAKSYANKHQGTRIHNSFYYEGKYRSMLIDEYLGKEIDKGTGATIVKKEEKLVKKFEVYDDVYHFLIKHIDEDGKLLLSKDDIKENTKEFIAKVVSAFELSPNIKPINGFYNVEFMKNVYLMQKWSYYDYTICEDNEDCVYNKNLTKEQILEAGEKEGKDYTPFMVKVE